MDIAIAECDITEGEDPAVRYRLDLDESSENPDLSPETSHKGENQGGESNGNSPILSEPACSKEPSARVEQSSSRQTSACSKEPSAKIEQS